MLVSPCQYRNKPIWTVIWEKKKIQFCSNHIMFSSQRFSANNIGLKESACFKIRNLGSSLCPSTGSDWPLLPWLSSWIRNRIPNKENPENPFTCPPATTKKNVFPSPECTLSSPEIIPHSPKRTESRDPFFMSSLLSPAGQPPSCYLCHPGGPKSHHRSGWLNVPTGGRKFTGQMTTPSLLGGRIRNGLSFPPTLQCSHSNLFSPVSKETLMDSCVLLNAKGE